jgi:hypothetical protein
LKRRPITEEIAAQPYCGALGVHGCPRTDDEAGRHWCAIALEDRGDNLEDHAGRHVCRCGARFDTAVTTKIESGSSLWLVAQEMTRVVERSLPDGTGGQYHAYRAVEAKRDAMVSDHDKRLTWREVLAERFWEVLAEDNPKRLAEDLTQLAAIACRWVEDVHRRERAAIAADRARRLKEGNAK